MKSILFLVENYYPRMSGVPVVVQYLAEGLLEKGYDVSICTKWYEGYLIKKILMEYMFIAFGYVKL